MKHGSQIVMILVLLNLTACQNDGNSVEPEELLLPVLAASLVLPSNWEKFVPSSGSITIEIKSDAAQSPKTFSYTPNCSGRPGSNPEFSYFIRRGSSSKLLINFMGGGACWHDHNCLGALETMTYIPEAGVLDLFLSLQSTASLAERGILDSSNPDNPFWDWNLVFIPYCTGDTHWGSNDFTYTDPVTAESHTIHHRGFDNFLATLNDMRQVFPSPEQVFVTGQSAGGFGAIYNFPYIKETYYDKRVDVLGDGADGITTSTFSGYLTSNWNAGATLPDWVTGIDVSTTLASLSLGDIYSKMAAYYPGSRFGQYANAYDGTQRYFYNVMKQIDAGKAYTPDSTMWGKGDGSEVPDAYSCEWHTTLLAEKTKAKTASNFRSYLAPGDSHTIGWSNRIHETTVAGSLFSSWRRVLSCSTKRPASDTVLRAKWCRRKTSTTSAQARRYTGCLSTVH